jgi:tetratricopeptide (TPR) repeat protein
VIPSSVIEQHQEVHRLLKSGDLPGASGACKALNETHPDFAPGWASASHIALRLDRPLQAVELIERALAIAPQNPRFTILRAHALWAAGDRLAARAMADVAVSLAGSDAGALHELGTFYSAAHAYPEALRCYAHAVELAPLAADYRFNYAAGLRIVGRLEEAEAQYDRVIAAKPDEYEAYFNRADLRHQSASRNHVAELQGVLARGIPHPRGEVLVRHALAKELEDLGRFAESFVELRRGAALRRRHVHYDVERDLATADWIIAAFPAPRLRVGEGCPSTEPIFVVGLPRSGTTLLERVLSGHSCVSSAGELSDFADALVAAARGVSGEERNRQGLIAAAAHVDFAAVGLDYLKRTRSFRGQTQHFIDKLPLNYLYCGPIHLALPRAKIIHLNRHPLAACHAMFKTLFKAAYPFSYDLGELARYYAAYRRLMRYWHEAMPRVILEVRYESLVRNLEAETRRILEFCELDFEPACLDFHRNPNPSATASASQVRRPLYDSSIALWRHYETELIPLREALIDAGIPAEELEP